MLRQQLTDNHTFASIDIQPTGYLPYLFPLNTATCISIGLSAHIKLLWHHTIEILREILVNSSKHTMSMQFDIDLFTAVAATYNLPPSQCNFPDPTKPY